MTRPVYRALISSDWSECLSPNGPFDPIAFTYPHLAPELTKVFRDYTGNRISLTAAYATITELLPGPLTVEHMDAYLDAAFRTYRGVPDLVSWCADHHILFMINSTGTQGYFQRMLAKGLLPDVPVIAANPLIRFSDQGDSARYVHEVRETADKGTNTDAIVREWNFPLNKIVVMGDSGGDGPHFEWATGRGIFTIGSMTKTSLKDYCRSRGIVIDELFGLSYAPGETRNVEEEMKVDFMRLTHVIEKALDL
jgi:2-hydroxy-3-keto-5-methylthiopentenyl-1-phosphate phosphatase